MESKEQSLSKIVTALSGVNYGKDVEENHIKRIANSLEGVTKEKNKSIIEILSGDSGGARVYENITIDVSGDTIKYSLEDVTEEEAASALNTTVQSVRRILNGEVTFLDIIYDTNARAFLTFAGQESNEDGTSVEYEDSSGTQFSIQRVESVESGVSVYFSAQ